MSPSCFPMNVIFCSLEPAPSFSFFSLSFARLASLLGLCPVAPFLLSVPVTVLSFPNFTFHRLLFFWGGTALPTPFPTSGGRCHPAKMGAVRTLLESPPGLRTQLFGGGPAFSPQLQEVADLAKSRKTSFFLFPSCSFLQFFCCSFLQCSFGVAKFTPPPGSGKVGSAGSFRMTKRSMTVRNTKNQCWKT